MIHLGSIGKTSIDIDISFLIVMGLFVATFYNREMGLRYALLWAPVLFLSVLLHELAHAGAIGAFGYGASQIVLGGMGGVTINKRNARPWQDMLISAAGPASSFAIAWLTTLFMRSAPLASHDPMLVAFLPLLLSANVWWGVFNLVPMNPLDGGHIVHNFLRMFLQERTAFSVAVWIGMLAGAAIVALGIYIGFYLLALLIAWYVFINFQQWQHFRKGGFPGG
jgi:stage IV sporulation protein FB